MRSPSPLTVRTVFTRLAIISLLALPLSAQQPVFFGQNGQGISSGITPLSGGSLTVGGGSSTTVSTGVTGVQIGDFIICGIAWGSTSTTVQSVSDDLSTPTTYAQDAFRVNTNGSNKWIGVYSGQAVATGDATVTLTLNAAGAFPTISCSRWSGVATSTPLDQTGDDDSSGSTNPSATTGGATAQTNELIYGFSYADAVQSTGASYTTVNNCACGAGDEYQIGAATQAYTADFTMASAAWAAVVTTYKHP